jgi:hypothetical protein
VIVDTKKRTDLLPSNPVIQLQTVGNKRLKSVSIQRDLAALWQSLVQETPKLSDGWD